MVIFKNYALAIRPTIDSLKYYLSILSCFGRRRGDGLWRVAGRVQYNSHFDAWPVPESCNYETAICSYHCEGSNRHDPGQHVNLKALLVGLTAQLEVRSTHSQNHFGSNCVPAAPCDLLPPPLSMQNACVRRSSRWHAQPVKPKARGQVLMTIFESSRDRNTVASPHPLSPHPPPIPSHLTPIHPSGPDRTQVGRATAQPILAELLAGQADPAGRRSPGRLLPGSAA